MRLTYWAEYAWLNPGPVSVPGSASAAGADAGAGPAPAAGVGPTRGLGVAAGDAPGAGPGRSSGPGQAAVPSAPPPAEQHPTGTTPGGPPPAERLPAGPPPAERLPDGSSSAGSPPEGWHSAGPLPGGSLPGGVVAGVLIEVRDGRIAVVRPGVATPPAGAVVLRGLTVPGLANAHSHAFHRALRGAAQVSPFASHAVGHGSAGSGTSGAAGAGPDMTDASAAPGSYATVRPATTSTATAGTATAGAGARGPGAADGVGAGAVAGGAARVAQLATGGAGRAGGRAPDSFWTWREVMYTVAERLTPDSYHALARATYAEMALAGITCVGEFHYLHHAPGGARYQDPNAMGEALLAAAADAGIRITLLDTAYLSSGFGEPPTRPQLRFSDGTADAWAERVSALKAAEYARIGAAIHSVRAVPADQLSTVAQWATGRDTPLHVHLSEQTAENDACRAAHGCTPTQLLAEHGALGPRSVAVHATHLTDGDIALLGGARTGVCMCPTTERDLADGIGPAVALQRAGSPLSLGSDSHAVIDLLEEARAMELDERLRTRARGHWTAVELLHAATAGGHAALGWEQAGRIVPGALADFTTLALDSVRTAGPPPSLGVETAVFAASHADVRHTIVGGRHIVRDGEHTLLPGVSTALAQSIAAVLG